jgi:UDP-N-acetylmuramyl pentapeptide phosphotransferase/UDP-N-acetylglucosamine-1-phosphate transferase
MQASAILQHLGFALLLALLSAGTVRLMIAFPILDHPNHRSAHARPTPRAGGVGVVLAFVAGMCALYLTARYARVAEPEFLGVIAAAVAIGLIGLVDDLRACQPPCDSRRRRARRWWPSAPAWWSRSSGCRGSACWNSGCSGRR